jgi:hypothetical protein
LEIEVSDIPDKKLFKIWARNERESSSTVLSFISWKSVRRIWAKTFFLFYSLFWEALTSSTFLSGLVSDSIKTYVSSISLEVWLYLIRNKKWFQKICYASSIFKLCSTFRFWNQIDRPNFLSSSRFQIPRFSTIPK